MRILTLRDITAGILRDTAVTIGNFDGVHRGHLELFRRLNACSAERGLHSVAVTFEPHPMKVLAPESAPSMITTTRQKAALIEAAGVDWLAVVPFTTVFAGLPADEFVTGWLCGSLGMRHIVIGHDYAFGRGREGDFRTLERLGAVNGFTVEYMEPVGDDGVVFSSSIARRLISAGDMEGAEGVLGRCHFVSGTVVHGRKVGHSIGFPTANVACENELLPPDGVYAVMARVDGALVQGACNIGSNPTFKDGARTVEVFLLDYSGQIYGHEIAIWFVKRLRDEIKFADVTALVDAIAQDVRQTRMILADVDQSRLQPAMELGQDETGT